MNNTLEPDSVLTNSQDPACRRIDARNEVILPGHVIVGDAKSGFSVLPAWTRDVSMSGAKIIVDTEISSKSLYFRVNLSQSGPTFIECEIRHRKSNTVIPFRGPARTQYQYGLQFTRLVFATELGPEAEKLVAPAAEPTVG